MSQDTSESGALIEPLGGLDDVVKQEPDSSNLMRFHDPGELRGQKDIRFGFRMSDVDDNATGRVRNVQEVIDVHPGVVGIVIFRLIICKFKF